MTTTEPKLPTKRKNAILHCDVRRSGGNPAGEGCSQGKGLLRRKEEPLPTSPPYRGAASTTGATRVGNKLCWPTESFWRSGALWDGSRGGGGLGASYPARSGGE